MFIRTLALAVTIAVAAASSATAQQVLSFDRERVFSESQVGQHINSRLEAISQEIQNELEAARAPLEQESQQLQAETQALEPSAIQQNPDLVQRINALQQRGQEFGQLRSRAMQELQQTEAQALQPVGQALAQIINQIAQERQASVVVPSDVVAYVAPNADITADVISRLNAQMQTVEVTRVRLPAQQQPAQGQ